MRNWSLKTFRVKDLKEYYKNPRKLSKNDYLHLKASIINFGLIDKPIATSEGQIIGGHQRKKILTDMGIEEIECWIPDIPLSEKEFEELNIRLNRNQGEWDFDILANQFVESDLYDWGFTEEEIPGMIEEEEEQQEETVKQDKLCPHCGKEI